MGRQGVRQALDLASAAFEGCPSGGHLEHALRRPGAHFDELLIPYVYLRPWQNFLQGLVGGFPGSSPIRSMNDLGVHFQQSEGFGPLPGGFGRHGEAFHLRLGQAGLDFQIGKPGLG